MKENMRKRNPLSPRNDYLFKRIFGDVRDKDILTDFLKAALDIPWDEYDKLEIINPESNIEYTGDKYNILDIKLHTKSDKVIDIEIQRYYRKTFRERIVYQESKLIEEQLGSGNDYGEIHKAICIVITEFAFIKENDEYHNRYEYYDKRTGSTFSDIACIHVFELAKLPEQGQGKDDSVLDWLRFMDCDEVKDMEAIAEKNEGVRKAVIRYKELTANERERMIAEAIEKNRRDRVAEMEYLKDEMMAEVENMKDEIRAEKDEIRAKKDEIRAKKDEIRAKKDEIRAEGRAEGISKGHAEEQREIAKRMKTKGLDQALISDVTGLPQEEVLKL